MASSYLVTLVKVVFLKSCCLSSYGWDMRMFVFKGLLSPLTQVSWRISFVCSTGGDLCITRQPLPAFCIGRETSKRSIQGTGWLIPVQNISQANMLHSWSNKCSSGIHVQAGDQWRRECRVSVCLGGPWMLHLRSTRGNHPWSAPHLCILVPLSFHILQGCIFCEWPLDSGKLDSPLSA